MKLATATALGFVSAAANPAPAVAAISNEENVKFSTVKSTTEKYEYYSMSDNWKKKNVYQIFPIAFRDSDGDGYGDLKGIQDAIPYFKKMNINALWLNPIFLADSYHKYDTRDYKKIDPQLGNMQDFDNLMAELKKNGIELILDFAFNHTSTRHKWFQAAIHPGTIHHEQYKDFYKIENDRSKSETNNKDKWRDISQLSKNITTPDDSIKDFMQNIKGIFDKSVRPGVYYSSFTNDSMADLNLHNDAVLKAIEEITHFWIDKGVTGFRLDATRHAYDTNEYNFNNDFIASNLNQHIWTKYTKEVTNYGKSKNKDIYVVAENAFSNALNLKQYVNSYSELNFPFYNDITNKKYTQDILKTFAYRYNLYRKIENLKIDEKGSVNSSGKYNLKSGNPDFVPTNFVGNHDSSRLASNLNYAPLTKEVYTLMLMLPGIPVIYYGDELGLSGKKNRKNDYSQRQPMPWGQNGKLDSKYLSKLKDFDPNDITKNDKNLNVEAEENYKDKNGISNISKAGNTYMDSLALFRNVLSFRSKNEFISNPNFIWDYYANNNQITGMKSFYKDKEYIILANFTDYNQNGRIHDSSDFSGLTINKSLDDSNINCISLKDPRNTKMYNILGDGHFNTKDYWEDKTNGFTLNSHSIIIIERDKEN